MEAIVQLVMLICFSFQVDCLEVAGEMIIVLIECMSEYDGIDTFSTVDVDSITEWSPYTKFNELP